VHSYPELKGWPTWERSFPEDPRLKKFVGDITDLCKWRNEHARGKEVWLTEFGYDATTKKPDAKTEFKDWVGVTDEQQAIWLARSWLLFATLPINRAYMYFFNDSDQPQVHGSSGLTRNFQPKPAFWAAAHLHKALGNFRFVQQLTRAGANIEEFVENQGGTNRVWVVWLPTGERRSEKIPLAQAPGKIVRAERLALRANEENLLPVTGTHLEVSDRPLFLFLQ
jgi:hypothetical protein